ncbi:MAG TPA: orotidine-5'-phosphate decarboxylase [Actinomycetota bacterium]
MGSGTASGSGSAIVLALDTPDLAEARALAAATSGSVGLVKVGLELFGAHGPDAVRTLRADGHRVMLDLKLHDIPATVGRAVAALVPLGAELLTVHAGGGTAMLTAAVQAARAAGPGPGPRIAAVTVLTSLGPDDLAALGAGDATRAATRLTRLALEAGCQALVCSPLEVARLRALTGPDVTIICPGVRPAAPQPDSDDQARVATPAAALAAGADLLVVGRPITRAPDPAAAAATIAAETQTAGAAR